MKKYIIPFLTIVVVCFTPNAIRSQSSQNNLVELSNDYAKYNLNESNTPEKWEDGIRTSGEKGTYEWWYFDAHLDDGSTVVIVFFTKFMTSINKTLTPLVTLNIDKADGTKIEKSFLGNPDDFFASKDSCNVKIGKNYFVGNLKNYEIHFEDEDLNLTANITRTTESWRPKTGHLLFGTEKSKEFNWVVPVPQGKVSVSYNHDDKQINTSGSGYHDHNWGNNSIMELFNHWYWSRAEIGPYNVIASEMIAEKEFNNESTIVFNVSKDGKTMTDNGEYVTLYRTIGKMHPTLNKQVSDNLLFIYDNPKEEYRYEYYLYKENFIVESNLLEELLGKGLKYTMVKMLTGINPAYFRFKGKAELRVYKGNILVDKHVSSSAVWELMYFGKPMGSD
jgi:hypothetical protein